MGSPENRLFISKRSQDQKTRQNEAGNFITAKAMSLFRQKFVETFVLLYVASVLKILRDILLLSILSSILMIAAVNGAVKLVGDGYPHLLSPLFFETKVEALLLWAKHIASNPLGDDHAPPEELIKDAALEFGVPEPFARAVAISESNLLPHRISAAGAIGIMQLMPFTARDMGVVDPFDSKDNIRGGVRYLSLLWKRYRGDKRRVAAAYNAGMGRVPKRGKLNLPGETRHYVKKVLRETRRLTKLAPSAATSPAKNRSKNKSATNKKPSHKVQSQDTKLGS